MAGDEGSAAALPSVDEMKARLAELVEQHGEGSEPVVRYQAELAAHPDVHPQGDVNAPEGFAAPDVSKASIVVDPPTLDVHETIDEDPPAEASKE